MLRVQDLLGGQMVSRRPDAPGQPLVSVILPTFCRYKTGHLERSVNSVLSQTFRDFEFIIMDDGSTDGSADFIRACQARDCRVVHVRHDRNSGIPALRVNEGIELARGKYLAFQFDDDLWRPRALEILVNQAKKLDTPGVVVGRVQIAIDGQDEGHGHWVLPDGELSPVTLNKQNLLANNAVLFPRDIVNQYGMYDCHLGMRRLCDWDLWLRYIRYLPFTVVDEIVSEASQYNVGSIGLTVPWDLSLFRYLHSIQRDSLLTLQQWRHYEIDSLRIGNVETDGDFRRRLYEEHVVPYYNKFRHYIPQVEGFPAFLPADSRMKSVLITSNDYNVYNDVTLDHYDTISSLRLRYRRYFQELSEVDGRWPYESDMLLLVRVVQDQARRLLDQAMDCSRPAGFYIDDDLLNFHEFGSQFNYIAPDTPFHRNLENYLGQVDAVWYTTPFLRSRLEQYSARLIPHLHNAIPEAWLPDTLRQRDLRRPVRIGYVGASYRIDEFRMIWDALHQISEEYGDRICFEFWGLDVSSFPKLHSPVKQIPFTYSYEEYIDRLGKAGFDILLTPLLDHPPPRLAKTLIKYLETAVAGALGIFSDVPPYQSLVDGLTCLKAKNTRDDWYRALKQALEMAPEQFDLIRQRAVIHVRQEYTAQVQKHKHEAALRATEFHAATRSARQGTGRPRVMYVFHSAYLGGAETQLWRRLHLARQYGIDPVVVLPETEEQGPHISELRRSLDDQNIPVELVSYTCLESPCSPDEFSPDLEKDIVRELLARWAPTVVHTTTFIPAFGQVCKALSVPHVASMYAVDDSFSWGRDHPHFGHCAVNHSDTIRYARRWSQLLGSEPFCSRIAVPEEMFELGMRRNLESIGVEGTSLAVEEIQLVLMGTVQPRKGQREAIEAVGQLRREGFSLHLHFYGYTHFFPDYVRDCERLIIAHNLQDHVTFHGFSADIKGAIQPAHVLLSLSSYESFPGGIAEAMAGRTLVVATPVGGVPEIVIDGTSGILCTDSSSEAILNGIRRGVSLSPSARQGILNQAWRVARSEFHPQRIAGDLFTMYNRAIEMTRNAGQAPTQTYNRDMQSLPAEVQFPIRIGFPRIGRRIKSRLRYELKIGYANWAGISVCLGTIRPKHPFKGTLKLNIYDLDNGNRSRKPIRLVDVEIDEIKNYGWADFYFDPIHNSENRRFRVEFRLETRDQATRADLCLLESKDFRTSLWNKFYHKYLRFGKGGVLAYRIRIGA